MKIGQLSKRTGLSKDTIRYYERLGLLPAQARDPSSGYKEYTLKTCERLHRIRFAKRLGFSLREIRDVLEGWMQGRLSQQQKSEMLRAKISVIAKQRDLLQEMEQALAAQLAQCEA